jgi:ATP adenylyltransferase
MDYILSEKGERCVFCDALGAGKEHYRENLILATRPTAWVILNRFPYTHAHIMVLPVRHVSTLESLSTEERNAMFELMVDSQVAIREALNPHGLNLGMNLGKIAGAGIEDHIHVHICPRWSGDTNFMPVLADSRVMPEHLLETYDGLAPAFARLNVD